jgi:hypothetical protein
VLFAGVPRPSGRDQRRVVSAVRLLRAEFKLKPDKQAGELILVKFVAALERQVCSA